jgi:hypothetical protein
MTDMRETAERITQEWIDAKAMSGAAYREMLVSAIATALRKERAEALEQAACLAIQMSDEWWQRDGSYGAADMKDLAIRIRALAEKDVQP